MQAMPALQTTVPFVPFVHAGQPDVDHPTKPAPDRGSKKPAKKTPAKKAPAKPAKKK